MDPVVVDLGANKGRFSEYLRAEYGCFCYAVEPTPNLFEQPPKANNVKKLNFVISDKNGPVRLHLSNNSEGTSLNKKHAEYWSLKEEVVIEGITLERLIAKEGIEEMELLKVDI